MSSLKKATSSPNAEKAQALKAEGNKLYTNGDLEESIKLYRKAFALDPLAVYLSNLSAAQYELGGYKDAVDTIDQALSLVNASEALRPKLLLRSAKAKAYLGRYDDAVADAQMLQQGCPDVPSDLKNNAQTLEKRIKEAVAILDSYSKDEAKWKNRILRLPRLKNAPRPFLEYYTTGQDYANSIMTAQDLDAQSDVIEAERVRMEIPKDSSPFEFAALFGGIGDARNFYGTLHDIANQLKERRNKKLGKVQFHFTLVDIHPTALARNVVVFFALDELSQMTPEDAKKSTKARQLLAMLHYLYWANIMPPTLYDLMMERIKSAHEEFSAAAAHGSAVSRSWLNIDSQTVKLVKNSLAWWLSDGPKAWVVKDMLPDMSQRNYMKHFAGADMSENVKKMERKEKDDFKGMLSDPQAVETLRKSALELGVPFDDYKKAMEDLAEDDDFHENISLSRDTLDGCIREREFFNKTRIFFPPSEVDEPMPFKRAVKIINSVKRQPDNLRRISKAAIQQRAMQHWKVNVTYLDRTKDNPDTMADGFSCMGTIFLSRHLKPVTPKPAGNTCLAEYSAVFFSHAAEGLRQLSRLGDDALKVEMMADDVWNVAEAISFGVFDRPSTYPALFDRLHFSNVTDYTGGHATMFSLGRPLLKQHAKAYMTSTCMLNVSAFGDMFGDQYKNADAFIYHFISAVRKELPSLFGLEMISKPTMLSFYSSFAAIEPRKKARVSHDQLLSVLYGVFLRCALPPLYPEGDQHRMIMQPRDVLNLHAVFRLLRLMGSIHPGHVLGEFVTSILENKAATRVPIHPTSPVAVPNGDDRANPNMSLCCSPFQAEFEVAAAMWRPLLPFPILCPVPSPSEIAIYSIAFETIPDLWIERIPRDHHSLIAVVGKKEEIEDAEHIRDLRNKIRGTPNFKTSLNLISTFDWIPHSAIAHLPLTRVRAEQFRSGSYSVAIVNTIFWFVTSSIEPCSRLVCTGDFDTPRPDKVPVLKPIGRVPRSAERAIMKGMQARMGGGPGGAGADMMASMMQMLRNAGMGDSMPDLSELLGKLPR